MNRDDQPDTVGRLLARDIARRGSLRLLGGAAMGGLVVLGSGCSSGGSGSPPTPSPTPTPGPAPTPTPTSTPTPTATSTPNASVGTLPHPIEVLSTIPNLLAYWDFAEPTGSPRLTKAGVDDFPLVDVTASNVIRMDDGPLSGYSGYFNGATDSLEVAMARTGKLNVGQRGVNQVTVGAWIKVPSWPALGGVIASVWREGKTNTRRQYALYSNLDLYGGRQRFIGHVSRTGNATPGYPWSRDYSAHASLAPINRWVFGAFTYDGEYARSYVDARWEARPVFTDEQGQTYSKNPYYFPDGLNPNPFKFEVGADSVGDPSGSWPGTANHFLGQIGGIVVFDRALTQAELMKLHLMARGLSEPVHLFDFYSDRTTSNARGHGWRALSGDLGREVTDNSSSSLGQFNIALGGTTSFMTRASNSSNNTIGMGYCDGIVGFPSNQIGRISFEMNNSSTADKFKLCVRIDDQWYASAADYSMARANNDAANWTVAETKSYVFSRSAQDWLALTVAPDSSLAIGARQSADLPVGDLTGIGFFATDRARGTARFRNLAVYRS